MNDKLEFTYAEFTNLLNDVVKRTTVTTLTELGMLKKTYTRRQIIETYGRRTYQKSLDYVKWYKKGDHKNSTAICLREDFDRFISRMNEELKPIK